MAPGKPGTKPGKAAADFNAIINADRQRRKNEALAQEIFSKNRRSSAPGAGISNRKPGTGPSLASRVGISKRTASASARPAAAAAAVKAKPPVGDVDAEWTHDLHSLNNPPASRASARGPRNFRTDRSERLHSAINGSSSSPALTSQFNIVGSRQPSSQLSIRGLAGPFTVMAKNFVAGTTVADIESAVTPVGGITLSCRLIAERPNVIAELVFETKEGADNVVDTFNGQNADGNILHVYHKIGASSITARANPSTSSTPQGPRADLIVDRTDDTRHSYGGGGGGSDRYAPRTTRSHEPRRDYDSRDDVVDGSYGFEDNRMDIDDRDYDKNRGSGSLYSDSIVGNNNRGRGTASITRDNRGRGGARGRDYR